MSLNIRILISGYPTNPYTYELAGKSYDDVVRDRVRNNMGDDLYIMNPMWHMKCTGRVSGRPLGFNICAVFK